MVRLGDICTKATSNIKQSDLEGNVGKYPIYGASGFIKTVDFYEQEKPYVAVVKDGAGVGRILQCPAYSSVIGTLQYILPNEDVNVSYLAYAMTHMNLSKYYLGAAIPHIYFKDYCNEELLDHSKEEQQHIAAVLDKVSELIDLRKQQLAKLDELVKSRFVEMFGDPISTSSKFDKQTFGDAFKITSGGTPATGESDYWENGTISWIGSNMCQDKIIYCNDGKFITETGLNNSSAKIFGSGTVLVALVGATIGKTALLRFSTATNQNVAAIDVNGNKAYNSEFVFYHLQFLYSKFQEIGSGKFKMANQSFVKNLPLLCVPLQLQNQFAAFVEQIDKQKLTIQQSWDKLEALKKSLLQEYFG